MAFCKTSIFLTFEALLFVLGKSSKFNGRLENKQYKELLVTGNLIGVVSCCTTIPEPMNYNDPACKSVTKRTAIVMFMDRVHAKNPAMSSLCACRTANIP